MFVFLPVAKLYICHCLLLIIWTTFHTCRYLIQIAFGLGTECNAVQYSLAVCG